MKNFKAPRLEDYATADEVEHRAKIKQAALAVGEAIQHHRQLLNSCKHKLLPMTDEVRFAVVSGEAPAAIMRNSCGICNCTFGWRCPNSPDTICHYFTVGGKVELFDQTKVDPPPGHDPSGESEDSCIYCGEPEDRA